MSKSENEFDYHGVSRIEFAKRLKALRDVLSDESYANVVDLLLSETQQVSVQRTMDGLDQEDEFAVMSALMGTVKTLVALDQTPILSRRVTVPDFIGMFAVAEDSSGSEQGRDPWIRYFIEVKSTLKAKHRSSGRNLEGLKQLARDYDARLLFAVRFTKYDSHPVWAIVEVPESATEVNISIEDMITGIRERLWNDVIYYIEQDFILELTFDKDDQESSFRSEEFGGLTDLQLQAGGRVLSCESADLGMVANCLLALNLRQVAVEHKALRKQTVIRLANESRFSTMADIMFHINRLASDRSGNILYNPQRVKAKVDQMAFSEMVDRENVEKVLQSLADMDLLVRMSFREFLMAHPDAI